MDVELSDPQVCTGDTSDVRLLQNLSPNVYGTNLWSPKTCAAWLCQQLLVLQVLLASFHDAAEHQARITCSWEVLPEPSHKPG